MQVYKQSSIAFKPNEFILHKPHCAFLFQTVHDEDRCCYEYCIQDEGHFRNSVIKVEYATLSRLAACWFLSNGTKKAGRKPDSLLPALIL